MIGEPFRPWKQFQEFIIIPEALCLYGRLSPGSKLCWGRLARYEGKTGEAFPSMKTLAGELGVSERNARKYVAELEAAGFIRREARRGHSNKFIFLLHSALDNTSAKARNNIAAAPRNDHSVHPGRIRPPKRVIKENQLNESQNDNDGSLSLSTSARTLHFTTIEDQHQLDRLRSAMEEIRGERPSPRAVTEVIKTLGNASLEQFIDYLSNVHGRYRPTGHRAVYTWRWFVSTAYSVSLEVGQ